MPKILEYPRASFKKSFELAKAVDELGDNCNIGTCAEKMGKAVSGGFKDIVSAAVKFNLISYKKGQLNLTQLYKNIKLAYDDKEKKEYLKQSFLGIPLFMEIYDKYKNGKLPVEILSKALVKEFQTEEKLASRVAGYFVEGARFVDLLKPDNSFNLIVSEGDISAPVSEPSDTNAREPTVDIEKGQQIPPPSIDQKTNNYWVHVKGPGMNTTIEIAEEDHLIIVDAILNTIKKRLKQQKIEDETTQSSS